MEQASTYRSKIDARLALPSLLLLGSACVLMAVERLWIVLAFMLLVLAFIIQIFLSTSYSIRDGRLRIRSGLFYRQSIPISSIRKMQHTNNIISAPALSFDRLEIVYDKYDWVIISPRDKEAFIAHLRRINPAIEVMDGRPGKRAARK